MNLTSTSGTNDWFEIVRFSLKLSECLGNRKPLLPTPINKRFFQDNCDLNLKGFSQEAIFRVIANRLYYGLIQIIIDHYKIKRDVNRNSIHGDVKKKISQNGLKKLEQHWKRLYEYRIWADYKPDNVIKYYKKSFAKMYSRFANSSREIIKILINNKIIE
ncbi:MAG: hypothetical protein GF364_21760 [Candidatus Lokiarchaeota archaeon]|nr:hypothetical protein [Candidatus Lokiarchaeota archaeon]